MEGVVLNKARCRRIPLFKEEGENKVHEVRQVIFSKGLLTILCAPGNNVGTEEI